MKALFPLQLVPATGNLASSESSSESSGSDPALATRFSPIQIRTGGGGAANPTTRSQAREGNQQISSLRRNLRNDSFFLPYCYFSWYLLYLLLESDLVGVIHYFMNFLAHLRYPLKLKVSKPLVR